MKSERIVPPLLIFVLLPFFTLAQQEYNDSFSIFTGGFVIKSSILSTTKFGYEFNKFGFIADFTYDDYRETWQDGSKSLFQILAISISGRVYLKPLGRGLFAELNAGIGRPALTTKENGQEKFRSAFLPISGFGIGWRFGQEPKGIFGEVGLRSTVGLKNIHLYTTDNEPNTHNVNSVSYQSWVFKRGEFSSQIYLGVGFSF